MKPPAWALMEADLENYEGARRLFREGTKANARDPVTWQAWALMEEKGGNPEKAREYMERSTPYLRTEKSRGIYNDFKKREARRSAGETVALPPGFEERKRKFLPALPQPWRRKDKDKKRTGKAFPSGQEKAESEAQVRRELEYFSRLSPQELVKEILARLDAAKPNPVHGISCPPDTVCYLGQCPYRGT